MRRGEWTIGFVGILVAAGLLSAIVMKWFGRVLLPSHIVSWEMIYCLPLFVSRGIIGGLAILLGIWAALGTSHWMTRTMGLVLGASYVGVLACCSVGRYRFDLYWAAVGTAAGVAAVLWMVRRAGIRIRRFDAAGAKSGRMQLTILQSIILTTIAGCIVLPTRWSPETYPLFHIVLGFVSPWMILGTKRPLLGLVALCVVFVALAVVMLQIGPFHDHPARVPMMTTVLVAETFLVASSLTFFRVHGFRLTNGWLSPETADTKAVW